MADDLCAALEKLKLASAESAPDSLEGSLDCLLSALSKNNDAASVRIQDSGILAVFSALLNRPTPCTPKIANVVAEVAKNESLRSSCSGLIPPLVRLLSCSDQEVLLQTGRALGSICYDSHALQAQLIRMGVIPTLVRLLGVHSHNEELTEMCLIALGNLAELESSREQLVSSGLAGELVRLFQKQADRERKEVILEVLAPLAESDVVKMQLVEAGLAESLLDAVDGALGGGSEEDEATMKSASDLLVLLLLGDGSMQKLFEEGQGSVLQGGQGSVLQGGQGSVLQGGQGSVLQGGQGSVLQRVLSWVPSDRHQLQLAGALAVANFARNDGNCIHMVDSGVVQKLLDLLARHTQAGDVTVQHATLSALRNLAIPVVNKRKMLAAGVADAVLKLLPSETPPVQFKLLGTLRMLIDGQAEAAQRLGTDVKLLGRLVEWSGAKEHAGVTGESSRLLSALVRHSQSKDVVQAVILGGGVKHLVTMVTSEHVIMQNEALGALRLIAALDLDSAVKEFQSASLVQILHRLLSDEFTAPEMKYSILILTCAVLGSESLLKEVHRLPFQDVVSRLRGHENKKVSQQASVTEQQLTNES